MRAHAVRMTVVLLVAFACTNGSDQPDGPRRGDPASQGGTLRVAVPDFWVANNDLDPQRAYSPEGWELFRCCLLRTLYSYNGRATEEGGMEPRPDLAAGPPEVSSDGLTWTFRLREGLRYAPPFEDTPIVALDLVRALERAARVASRDTPGFLYFAVDGFRDYRSGVADSIVGLETPDDRTLVVRLDRVTSDLAYRFSLAATAPIPEGADLGHDTDYASYLVASGPYMIEGSARLNPSVPPDEQQPADGYVPPDLALGTPGSLVLVRNPSWDPATDGLRAAYPDRIEVTLGGLDSEEIARRVDAADLDLDFGFGGSAFEQVARYRDDPALEDRLFVHPNDAGFAVTMNLAVPPFDDVHVRRAVAYAIDKAALVEILTRPPHLPIGHTGEVATHLAPDALEGSLLRGFDPYPHDPEAARSEMLASAYDRNGDGRCDAPVCRNVRTLVNELGVIPEQAQAISEDLTQIGIELDLQITPYNRFFGDPPEFFRGSVHDPRAQNAMVISYPWLKDFPEGAGWFLGLFGASSIPGSNTSLLGASPGQLHEWGYEVTSVPSVEDRIQACLQRRGVSRTECWAELDQYLMTEVVPRVPYVFMEHTEVVSERVVAYSFDQFAALPALDRIVLAPGSK
jgi:peptide/nickel transport system substrate-binding protein